MSDQRNASYARFAQNRGGGRILPPAPAVRRGQNTDLRRDTQQRFYGGGSREETPAPAAAPVQEEVFSGPIASTSRGTLYQTPVASTAGGTVVQYSVRDTRDARTIIEEAARPQVGDRRTVANPNAVRLPIRSPVDERISFTRPETQFERVTRSSVRNPRTGETNFGLAVISPTGRENIRNVGLNIATGGGRVRRTIGSTIARVAERPESAAFSGAINFAGGAGAGFAARRGVIGLGRAAGGTNIVRRAVVERGTTGVLGVGGLVLTGETLRRTEPENIRAENIIAGGAGFGRGFSSRAATTSTSGQVLAASEIVTFRAPRFNIRFGGRSNTVNVRGTTVSSRQRPNNFPQVADRQAPVNTNFLVPRGLPASSVRAPGARSRSDLAAEFNRLYRPPSRASTSVPAGLGGGFIASRPGSTRDSFALSSSARSDRGLNPVTGEIEFGSATSGGQILLFRQQTAPPVAVQTTASLSSIQQSSGFLSTANQFGGLQSPGVTGVRGGRSSGSRLATRSRSRGSFFETVLPPASSTSPPSVFFPPASIPAQRTLPRQRIAPVQSQSFSFFQASSQRQVPRDVFNPFNTGRTATSRVPRPAIPGFPAFFPPIGGGGGGSGFGVGRSRRRSDRYSASLTARVFGIRARRGGRQSGGFGGFEVRGI